jgi:tRNA uridine 5-carboxymethylaminomethyl modification enzyme
MFTSLAEYRLELRHDNADSRLLHHSAKLGLLSRPEISYLSKRLENIKKLPEIFASVKIKKEMLNSFLNKNGFESTEEGSDVLRLLKRPGITIDMLLNSDMINRDGKFSYYELKQAETIVKYEGYIKRQNDMIEKFDRNEKIKLSQDINYSEFKGLKKEAVEKLNRIKPVSVGQAGRIAGISPADISVILVNLKSRGMH